MSGCFFRHAVFLNYNTRVGSSLRHQRGIPWDQCSAFTTFPTSLSLPLKYGVGIVALATAIPTIIGINEATKGTQDQEQKRQDANRKQRSHLLSMCELTATSGRDREQIDGANIALRDGLVGPSIMPRNPALADSC